MRSRRNLLLILIVLVLGVTTNIAVAWLLTLHTSQSYETDYHYARDGAIYVVTTSYWQGGRWTSCRLNASPAQINSKVDFYRSHLARAASAPRAESQSSPERTWLEARGLLGDKDLPPPPAWFDPARHASAHAAINIATGWPLPALSYNWLVRGRQQNFEHSLPSMRGSPMRLPLRPHPLPFLANTALYATLWLIPLVLIPCAVRHRIRARRRRHGRCPTCNYDLCHDHNAGCPECGWNRADQATAPA